MPSILIIFLTLAAVVAAATGSPARALTVLLAWTYLVPSTLVLPHSPSGNVTTQRLVELGGAIALARLAVRRQLPRGTFAPTRAHVALLAFLATTLATGVALADPRTNPVNNGTSYELFIDQAFFFVVVLGLLRACEDLPRIANVLGAVVLGTAVIALAEEALGSSYARDVWLRKLPDQLTRVSAGPLQDRGGQVRVRVAADFALQYGWLLVALLPFVVLWLLRARRWRAPVLVLGSLATLAAFYFTFARSAVLGLLVVAGVMAILARDRAVSRLVGVAAAGGGLLYLSHPSTFANFALSIDQGSITSRTQRLPFVLDAAAKHPYKGLGFDGLSLVGFSNTDDGYLLLYVSAGCLAVILLGVLLLTCAVQSSRGTLSRDPTTRHIAAAATAGIIAIALSGFTYDAFSGQVVMRTLFLLTALATAAAERTIGPARALARPSWPRAGLVVAALAIGLGVRLLAPTHATEYFSVRTLPLDLESAPFNPAPYGDDLVNTVCGIAASVSLQVPGATVDCNNPHLGMGYGDVRVSAATQQLVDEALATLARDVGHNDLLHSVRFLKVGSSSGDLGTLARTAPATLGVLGLAGALLLPSPGGGSARRRRRPGAPDGGAPDRLPEQRAVPDLVLQ